MITVSDSAQQFIVDLLAKEYPGGKHFVRVGVKGGGCSGLEYELKFDESLNESDKVYEDKGIKIVVDLKSLLYLYGTQLDYSGGLNGKGLYFINPNASRTCGCGESYAV